MTQQYSIPIRVETFYIENQSDEQAQRFVFAYTITISNGGSAAAFDLLIDDPLTDLGNSFNLQGNMDPRLRGDDNQRG